MREITAGAVTEAVSSLFIQANYELGEDVLAALRKARTGVMLSAFYLFVRKRG